jgi:hypothetical protein
MIPRNVPRVELAVQGNWKRHLATPHYYVTATLSNAVKILFDQQIAQLRVGKDAQLGMRYFSSLVATSRSSSLR